MPDSFNWLHLTDLHFGQSDQGPLWSNTRAAFFADLEKLHNRCGPWHAVLFTGDLVFSGQREQFDQLEAEVLGRLWGKLKDLGSGDAVLLAVPGNHDLARPAPTKRSAALRQLFRRDGFDEIAGEFWNEPEGEYRQIVVGSLANYSQWWANTQFRGSFPIIDGALPGDFATTLTIGGRHIGIVGLNTTFLQLDGGDYQGRLVIDPLQAHRVCGDAADWAAKHDACLFLTHQGPEWLTQATRQEAYPEINPAGRFAMHLFGHMHEAALAATSLGGGLPLRTWQGCSLFGMERFGDPPTVDRKHGYGAGKIEFGDDDMTVRYWPRVGMRDANGLRLVPDHKAGVLGGDESTPPERLPSRRKTKRPSSPGMRAVSPERSGASAVQQTLLNSYAKAARKLWDIVDLTGLPEDERSLAMSRFFLRQLYTPLRIVIQRSADDDSLVGHPTRREPEQSAPAGRPVSGDREDRLSLGAWLKQALTPKEKGEAKSGDVAAGPAAEAPRFVLLGDPGAGKTTLLRWLATSCLLRFEDSPDLGLLPDVESLPEVDWLPILVRCRDLDKARVGQYTLDDILHDTLPKLEIGPHNVAPLTDLLRERLADGRAVLLIDGLDEIADFTIRAAFCARIEELATLYSRAPIIATARIVGYQRVGGNFVKGTISELEPNEKDAFIRRWCEVTIGDKNQQPQEEESLRRGIHGHDRVERLTGNPMLLTTVALVQRRLGKLPLRRHELYWEAVRLLLRGRRIPDETPIDASEALPQLEYLAYVMCDAGQQQVRQDEVIELLDRMRQQYPNVRPVQQHTPETFLAQLERQTGLFRSVGTQQYNGRPVQVCEFWHLTFQEYLAALALMDGYFPGHASGTPLAHRVAPLAGRVADISSSRGSEPKDGVDDRPRIDWRESLRLCVASCNNDDVAPVLTAIVTPARDQEARPRAILAASCLADEPNVTNEQAEQILRQFARQVSNEDGSGNIRTGLDRTAMELANTEWATQLLQSFTNEFMESQFEQYQNAGGIVGMVQVSRLSAAEAERVEWMRGQIARLGSPSPAEASGAALGVMEAAFESKAMMVPDLIEALLSLLSRGARSAHASAWALGWLATPQREQALWTPTSESSAPVVRCLNERGIDPRALYWLLRICWFGRLELAAPSCIELLTHPTAFVRANAAIALGRVGDAAAVGPLSLCLREAGEDVDMGVAIATALGELGDRAAVPALTACLRDSRLDGTVRTAAVRALGQIRDEASVEPLSGRLRDSEENKELRFQAADELGGIGSASAIATLGERLLDSLEDSDIRAAAARGLATTRVAAVVPFLEKCLKDSTANNELRAAVLEALGQIGDASVVPTLKFVIRDSNNDSDTRQTAVWALGQISDAAAIATLTEVVRDPDDVTSVRTAAAAALGTMRNRAALPSLMEIPTDQGTDAELRIAALDALAEIGDTGAVPALEACVFDLDLEVEIRQAAVGALVTITRDDLDRALLSRDLDGLYPWLDPRDPISEMRTQAAAETLQLTLGEVKQRYEALAGAFGLTFTWRP